MKRIVTFFLFTFGLLSLTACHQEQNDLFSTAIITLSSNDNISISRVQAQAEITNVNTRQVVTTANFDGPTLQVELLRGAYAVLVEGVATCLDADGNKRLRQFRAQTDYVELASTDTNVAQLNIIFLD